MKTVNRCNWVSQDPLYQAYHDNEWGVPVYDDATLFEFILLESMQAGLSWITVLKKREHYRAAFDQFDYLKIAQYDDLKVEELMQNAGIIRNRLKIMAAINNAQKFQRIQDEFGSFSNYIWAYVDQKPLLNQWKTIKEVPATTPLSDQISKDLKKRGFKFLGTTTMYAFMQAVGIVNDHVENCFRYPLQP